MIFLQDFSFPFLLEIIFRMLFGNFFVLKMVVEHVVIFGLSDDFKALNELEYLIKEICVATASVDLFNSGHGEKAFPLIWSPSSHLVVIGKSCSQEQAHFEKGMIVFKRGAASCFNNHYIIDFWWEPSLEGRSSSWNPFLYFNFQKLIKVLKQTRYELSLVFNSFTFPVENQRVVISFLINLHSFAGPPMDFLSGIDNFNNNIGVALLIDKEVQVLRLFHLFVLSWIFLG